MYRQPWIVLALLLTLLITSVGFIAAAPTPVAQAQQGAAPLVFLKDGDLWKWDGVNLTQLTTWGYNQKPVLSPDGTRVAYSSWAEITVNAIAAGKQVFGLIPSNIWVLETATANAFRPADQPANASYLVEGVPDVAVMRGTPAWSPDGSKLAWSQYTSPEARWQLAVYDFNTNQVRVIVDNLPAAYADGGIIPLHEVLWGGRGILVRNVAINASTGEFDDTLHLYAPDGTPIHDTVIGSSSTEFAFLIELVEYMGQERLGVSYPSGRRFLIDPATGDQQPMEALPELYSKTAPANAATVVTNVSTDEQGTFATWMVNYPGGQRSDPLPGFHGAPDNIAISPDGQSVAFITDAVYVWTSGQITAVPGTQGIAAPWDVAVVWAPNAWRVPTGLGAGPAGVAPTTIACSLPPRLTIGGTGQVTPGLPNALRSLPQTGPASTIYAWIPGSATFNVIGGPQCDGQGRYWWQVTYQGVTGWTPEGEYGIYWLQPYTTQPQQVACTLAPRLRVGSVGYVTPGLPNLIRTQPNSGPGSIVLGIVPGNALFDVLSGPQCDNQGRYWWQIRYGTTVGWTPEGQYGVYWLAPSGCPNSPSTRLLPGMLAVVNPGDPNRLRSGPGTTYSVVGQVPAGGVFAVLSGPQCGPEGWTYWRVQYGSQIGWTAEGGNGQYWISPLGIVPPPPPTPQPQPTPQPAACTLTPRLRVGEFGQVTPGLPNALRTQPRRGPDSIVLLEIPGGGMFTVVNGPQCDGQGRYWWQVNYNGVVGWTPEGEAGTYWLEPAIGSPGPEECAQPRLMIGASGFVTPGDPNTLRSAPGGGAVVGSIPGGGFFRVLSGPQCDAQGIMWWQVNYNGVVGWTGESQRGQYWTSPFICVSTGHTRLVPGMVARVTPGDPNTLRSAPGGGGAIGSIPGGASFTVVGGPQCGGDGRTWWQVNYNGQVGWTAEGQGGVYWLEPVN